MPVVCGILQNNFKEDFFMLDNTLKNRFIDAKKALFDKLYDHLNKEQREAVFSVNGPLLILAGAGSGKTTVLVNRIAHIIKYGDAYYTEYVPENVTLEEIEALENAISLSKDEISEILIKYSHNPCPPRNFLAITFTNKAAKEINSRLEAALGEKAAEICSGTFHSTCVRLLRIFGEKAGYRSGFTIYDTDDTKKLITNCMKELNIDEKSFPVKTVQNEISRLKDNLNTPKDAAFEAGNDFKLARIAAIYKLYQQKLFDSNALDFDDIIMQTVLLLKNNNEVLSYCRTKFRYVSVDEYQDTNPAQFELVKLISGLTRNIMVVGDDDQSIYKFRGATIENILGFDKEYSEAKIVKLEQNYRSSGNILEAANAVIRNNIGRRGKELRTDRDSGEKIVVKKLENQIEEAKFIVNKIMELVIREKRRFNDFAVLYRTNSQSNSLEQVFSRSGVNYRILGGTRFYDRKEIKDIIAYLCLINNHEDDMRLKRIINEPKRKIGDSTISAVESIANLNGTSMFAVIEEAEKYPAISKSASKLKDFAYMIHKLTRDAQAGSLRDLTETLLDISGYRQMLIDGGEPEKERLENIGELITNIIDFENNHEDPSLSAFLEESALINDVDSYNEGEDAVVMMTIHSAKGLEFPVVFLPGAEEGIFPGMKSTIDDNELEEERRLAYVAITRAKDRLFCTHVRERMMFGRTQYNHLSRFVNEIPTEFLESDERRIISDNGAARSTRKSHISKEFYTKSAIASSAPKPKSQERFDAGNEVLHQTFGKGVVLSARAMGNDILYEIAFDSCGTKKLWVPTQS